MQDGQHQQQDLSIADPAVRIAALEDQIRQLHQQLEDSARVGYLAQKRFAQALQEKNAASEALAAAVTELNARLRMLLTSRLLHLGWRLGLGKTPYWNDPATDELTDLIEQLDRGGDVKRKKILEKLGAALCQPGHAGADMESALSHLVQKGFTPSVVLDVGAGKGYWTQTAAYRWPQAEFFMIDPLAESEPHLQAMCQNPRFHYLRLAVGDRSGDTAMHVAPDPDSSSLLLVDDSDPVSHQTVCVRTIDGLLDSGELKPPQLIKIDVQGFELNVLKGASKVFEHAEVFIVEANLFQFMPNCPRLHELIGFMAGRGFYPFDFAGFLRRPLENDLGQVDVVFVSGRSPMVASNRWLSELPPAEENHPIPPQLCEGLIISVIICTKDPRSEILNRTLDALDRQTLGKDRFEVIVVDNASRLELELNQLSAGRSLTMRVISEPIPGLSRARCAGISQAKGELLVFVDDDNFLAPDYLERALEIARKESRIGLFGGIAEAELESPIAKWKRPVLPHLGVRNHGDQPITKFADRWGEWEPIGAGMVARRSVAQRFVGMLEEIPEARILGRSGSALLSGEDSLFARAAYREGYACSYQPALRLTHFIKSSRLTTAYMSRVVEGHGRSYVILQRALGKPVAPLAPRTAVARMLYRLKDVGPAGFITGRWEIGYAKECQSLSTELPFEVRPRVSLKPATMRISVVLCARNPRADLLRRTLDSLIDQRFDRSEFEIIIVDNDSADPITRENTQSHFKQRAALQTSSTPRSQAIKTNSPRRHGGHGEETEDRGSHTNLSFSPSDSSPCSPCLRLRRVQSSCGENFSRENQKLRDVDGEPDSSAPDPALLSTSEPASGVIISALTDEESIRTQIVREPRPGHVFARSAGIMASTGELILFVDDDNFLEPNYLANAARISREHPEIGAFGGIAEAEFEQPPAKWKLPLLKYLAVRDHGSAPMTLRENGWDQSEPIGAGMVVRRDVAERFVRWVRDVPGADELGRSDRRLMSGDDALFSRAARRMGYSTSYQPALRLTHYLKAERFRLPYLVRLIAGHGRTHVLLNLITETPQRPPGIWRTMKLMVYRVKENGSAGLLLWFWDLGRCLEWRRRRGDPRAA